MLTHVAFAELPYGITKDNIRKDLVEEPPTWILSAYAPGKDAPEQLIGGYPREQSFEEIRLHQYQARMAGNEQAAVRYPGARGRNRTEVGIHRGADFGEHRKTKSTSSSPATGSRFRRFYRTSTPRCNSLLTRRTSCPIDERSASRIRVAKAALLANKPRVRLEASLAPLDRRREHRQTRSDRNQRLRVPSAPRRQRHLLRSVQRHRLQVAHLGRHRHWGSDRIRSAHPRSARLRSREVRQPSGSQRLDRLLRQQVVRLDKLRLKGELLDRRLLWGQSPVHLVQLRLKGVRLGRRLL
jgi:hypothetical protein